MCKSFSKFFRLWIADSLDGCVFLIKLFPFYLLRVAHDDTAGIKIIIESLAFTQELRREEQVEVFAFQFWFKQELKGIFLI